MSGHHKWPPPSGRITALSTTEAVETMDELLTEDEAEIARLREDNGRLRALLYDVANSGVAQDNPRIGYVEVQIDRTTWAEITPFVRGGLG